MLDKLRKAMSRADAVEPMPSLPPSTAMVPVVTAQWRTEKQAGALDQLPDSSRPTLLPAPPLRTFDEEQRLAYLPAAAHARHLSAVSGFLAYGCELNCAWIAGGDGLRANIVPDVSVLGWSEEEAAEWSARAEYLFADWSNDHFSCDAQGRQKFGAMQSAAVRSWLLTGDIIAAIDYGPKRGAAWRTSLNMIDPLRVSSPLIDYGVTSIRGIELDDRGRAVAYHVRSPDRSGKETRLPVFGKNGRRLVFHAYDGDAGTVRGTSPLASAVGGILQSMSAADAAVLAAHINATIMGTLTSDLPSEQALQAFRSAGEADPAAKIMEARIGWHEGLKKSRSDLQLGHGARVVHLMSGERFDLHAGQKPFDDYDTILKHGLREAARALGISYEMLTSDKSEASYASLKWQSTETRGIIDRRRKLLIEPLCEFALEAIIEEAVATGMIHFPRKGYLKSMSPLDAFREVKRFALRAQWTGPAIPDPDSLKEARAATLRVQSGLSSLSHEISTMGRDPDATFDEIARDKKKLKERKIFLPQNTEFKGRQPAKSSDKENAK